jgi:4-amino-4-deoxy-L-arabinose transferase-like glycosyltransferase
MLTESVKKHPLAYGAFALLLVAAAFLRLYGLEEYITFLGDQGRDAIVIKRMVTGEDFPGIGPRSSIGQVFLGPFYYYLMAPFLALSGLNPVGLAFGVAFLSLVGLILAFVVIRHRYGLSAALAFTAMVTFSYAHVWLSRFSWNPNLLPVFSFFALFMFSRILRSDRLYEGILFGLVLGACLQFHYLMLLLMPAFAVVLAISLIRDRMRIRPVLKQLGAAVIGFGAIFAPLILFDIKNGFLNVKGIIGIFTEKQFESGDPYPARFLTTTTSFLENVVQLELPDWSGIILFLAVGAAVAYLIGRRKKTDELLLLNGLAIISFLTVFAFVDTGRYLHYYTPVYYSLYLLVAAFLVRIPGRTLAIGASITVLALSVVPNAIKLTYLTREGNFQTRIAEKIADDIIGTEPVKPFHLLSIPMWNTNDAIRYYLEIKDYRPLAMESLERAETLYMLCYEKDCNPIDDPQYHSVAFGPKKVAETVLNKEVTIYKLIHAE